MYILGNQVLLRQNIIVQDLRVRRNKLDSSHSKDCRGSLAIVFLRYELLGMLADSIYKSCNIGM